MQEFFRFIEEPRACSYLKQEMAALEVRAVAEVDPAEYSDLLARGYRRFGWQLFRPACPSCNACKGLRVLVSEFSPSGSDRRVLRSNEHIRSELHPLFVTREHVDLYNRYHRFMHVLRGWRLQQTTVASYRHSFLSGPANLGRQWLYFDGQQLKGVALMDQTADAISLVYFFYDPQWRPHSPGRFSILNQLEYAKTQGLKYAYLGYWIEQCQSMNYKNRFRPHQIQTDYVQDDEEPVWR